MRGIAAAVQRLMTTYRSGLIPDAPVMASATDAAAYAAYRMPATASATAMALRQMRLSLPGWAPATLLDFGAGTGGAAWAAADELPDLRAVTLLEQSPDAIRLGKAILSRSASATLRAASWRSWQLPVGGPDRLAGNGPAGGGPAGSRPARGGSAPGLPAGLAAADLATAAYMLGELTSAQQQMLVALTVRAAPAVLLVEPGTPAGHRRILAARSQLIDAGYRVAAPCPHELGCPLDVAGDWCHFAARLQRSGVHRQAKGAELSYEDEKFSYVAAIRYPSPDLPVGRIVRRPQQRKGLVLLDLCGRDGTASRALVSKSKGEAYRVARKVSWGDRWNG
jgi:ribosomal protein RSM22 (predicted rRNA methylase)